MLNRVVTTAIGTLALALPLSACGSSDPVESTAPAGATTAEIAESGDALVPTPSAAPAPTTEPTATATPVPTPPSEPFVGGEGAVAIDQLTAETGNESYPLLEWGPVEGAAQYTVTLYHPDGGPWWGWFGDETSVTLGGVDTTSDIGGPRAAVGATWLVLAHDADGALLASSPRRAVEP